MSIGNPRAHEDELRSGGTPALALTRGPVRLHRTDPTKLLPLQECVGHRSSPFQYPLHRERRTRRRNSLAVRRGRLPGALFSQDGLAFAIPTDILAARRLF